MSPRLMSSTPNALRWALTLALLLLGAGPLVAPAAAQGFGFGAKQYAQTELFARVEGDRVQLVFQISIDDHWHLYHDDLGPEDAVGMPTEVTIDAAGASFGPVRFPEPKRYTQKGVGTGGQDTWINGHEGQIELYALGRITDPETFELAGLTAALKGLTCKDDDSCVPYRETVEVAGPGPDALFASFPPDLSSDAEAPSVPLPPAGLPAGVSASVDYSAVTFPEYRPRDGVGDAGPAVERGLLVWLLLAFIAGAILNVMPCVLPVISIKVLSFVQQAGEDKRRVLHLGISFATGILVVFWALAIAAIVAGQSWGQQFQSETFLISTIAVVFAFSLSMFGVYELGVPAGVGALAGMRREGLVDAFFKGMLATLLATPCSGPFLGSTLTWALKQPSLVIFSIFTALGLGMAVPYVILTAQPKLLKRLPKPGPWMDTFKQAMGFVLLATILFLMISLRQDLMLFAITFLVFVALGCWWYGRFATFEKTTPHRMAHLGVAVLIAVVGARLSFVEFPGVFENESAEWVAFEPDLFQRHLDEGRPVFVDFTADWCVNCKVNEKFVFDSEAVRAVMRERGVVAMKADTTQSTPYTAMLARFMEQLGGRSIPFLAVFDPTRPEEPIVKHAIVTQDTMIEVFRSLPTP